MHSSLSLGEEKSVHHFEIREPREKDETLILWFKSLIFKHLFPHQQPKKQDPIVTKNWRYLHWFYRGIWKGFTLNNLETWLNDIIKQITSLIIGQNDQLGDLSMQFNDALKEASVQDDIYILLKNAHELIDKIEDPKLKPALDENMLVKYLEILNNEDEPKAENKVNHLTLLSCISDTLRELTNESTEQHLTTNYLALVCFITYAAIFVVPGLIIVKGVIKKRCKTL